jgi:Undecaprenyl-phosphate glucose phosphotransferase
MAVIAAAWQPSMSIVQDIGRDHVRGAPRRAFGNVAVSCAIVAAETFLIIAAAIVSGAGYHLAVYGAIGGVANYTAFGMLAALLYVVPFIGQGESSIRAFLAGGRSMQRIALRWHVAFLLIAVIGFLTKSTDDFSRGWIALFFLIGLFGLLRLEPVAIRLFRRALDQGRVRPRRLMLVGSDADLAAYRAKRSRDTQNDLIVAVTQLAPAQFGDDAAARASLAAALRSAGDDARSQGVDDILLLPATRRADVLTACLNSFSLLPVGVHLDAFSDIDPMITPKIEAVGPIVALTLSSSPERPAAVLGKRVFDVVVALLALIVLAPFFAVVAALIKLDSAGPVVFRQRRRGYNHQEFSIYKLRTMTTLEDGDHVKQACRNDPRITRVGRVLRRWNLDELPQLLNVLKGEMSIVGPRPHAVAHDRFFETRINRYARRLNVKPGITGWAQVNGFRGETDTDEKMSQRVAHDLHYIDNWSLPFDLYIIALTVTSPRAFANAR